MKAKIGIRPATEGAQLNRKQYHEEDMRKEQLKGELKPILRSGPHPDFRFLDFRPASNKFRGSWHTNPPEIQNDGLRFGPLLSPEPQAVSRGGDA